MVLMIVYFIRTIFAGAQVFLNVVDSTGNSGGILNGVVQGAKPLKTKSVMKSR